MIKSRVLLNTGIILGFTLTGVTGCSMFSKVGKSVRNMTNFGGHNRVAVNESLVIPPSLKQPVSVQRAKQQPRRKANVRTAAYRSNKNYYIVVGTYPDQNTALDTFVRLSSIGLPGATMESRATRAGKVLHMVRLGPYHKQEDIDRVKDSLTSDGLSQFKVVEN